MLTTSEDSKYPGSGKTTQCSRCNKAASLQKTVNAVAARIQLRHATAATTAPSILGRGVYGEPTAAPGFACIFAFSVSSLLVGITPEEEQKGCQARAGSLETRTAACGSCTPQQDCPHLIRAPSCWGNLNANQNDRPQQAPQAYLHVCGLFGGVGVVPHLRGLPVCPGERGAELRARRCCREHGARGLGQLVRSEPHGARSERRGKHAS